VSLVAHVFCSSSARAPRDARDAAASVVVDSTKSRRFRDAFALSPARARVAVARRRVVDVALGVFGVARGLAAARATRQGMSSVGMTSQGDARRR
jgi:hypothetical protein